MQIPKTLRLVSFIAVFAIVLAACGSAAEDTDSFEEASADIVAESELIEQAAVDETAGLNPAGGAAERSAPDLGSGGVADTNLTAQIPTRNIIFQAELVMAVSDVASASQEVSSIVGDFGGFLFGQDTVGVPEPRTTLIFKVAPNKFQAALSALDSVGDVRSQTVSADDVTERVVDLESRILTAEKSVERLQTLLSESTDIETILEMERQLLTRESDLESLRGTLRTIRDAADLATISVTLTEAASRPALNVGVTAYPGHADQGASCPGSTSATVDEGETALTVCYELFNAGDTPLTDFSISDAVIDVDSENVIVVFGNLSGTIEPGESIILAAEVAPQRTVRTLTNIKATPLDQDGEAMIGRTVSTQSTIHLSVVDPGGLPGFSDGLSSGWELALIAWSGTRLVAGFLSGIAPILAVVAGAWWWRRRRTATVSTPPPVPVGSDEEA